MAKHEHEATGDVEYVEVNSPPELGEISGLYVALIEPGVEVVEEFYLLDTDLVSWSRRAATSYGVTFGDFVWGAINELKRGKDVLGRFEAYLNTAQAEFSDRHSEQVKIVLPETSRDWLLSKVSEQDLSIDLALQACLLSRQNYCEVRAAKNSDDDLPEVAYRRERFMSFARMAMDLT